jgi:short subunit dehydrogenase-like uncharacterized protein
MPPRYGHRVASRIVLFGATGYTGRLTARSLVDLGRRPVLAARNEQAVAALAKDLGDLEYAVADVARPATVHALVGRDDVLISTVGPFNRWGTPAVEAAVNAGAHYIDSTGEPPFVRQIFETWGPRAKAAGSALLTAMGYDYVPGNLAAALALRDAGPAATAVDVGYFSPGAGALSASGGTRASMLGAIAELGFARRGGTIVSEPPGVRYRRFAAPSGKRLAALSLGGSEHYTLPLAYPGVRDVGVYLGWFGPATPVVSGLQRVVGRVMCRPPVQGAVTSVLTRVVKGSTGGPDETRRGRFGTLAIAEARDDRGSVLARATVRGPNPYDLTGGLMAWAADRIVAGELRGTGALGPVDAFSLEVLEDGARQLGLTRTE